MATSDSYFADPSNTIIFFDGEEADMGVEDDGDLPCDDANNLAAYAGTTAAPTTATTMAT